MFEGASTKQRVVNLQNEETNPMTLPPNKDSQESSLLYWPGKTVDGGGLYPAACHMLDVAAVAEILVRHSRLSVQQKNAIVLLATLHDLGKFSASFRNMITSHGYSAPYSHWELTECLLSEFDTEILEPVLLGQENQRMMLYAATAGHHGKPPSRLEADRFANRVKNEQVIGKDATQAALNFTKHCSTFWPDASLEGIGRSEAIALSWWLPGFVTVCDWIGSNSDWFPPVMQGSTLEEHLLCARKRAQIAVANAGINYGTVLDTTLYDFTFRPMQQAATKFELIDGPMLAIIEDETGAGKTEAAMILAQRMLLAEKGNGIFFALPTMATSNAMFKRAVETVGKLFAAPSLTLAHGRANLSVEFRDIQGRPSGTDEDVSCAPWLADGRRRALLAQVGVGTIDQAFLSVLPTKHNSLRIWGLSQKILIVDEVHEMGNPYMEEELKVLLQAHAMQGGSAILLSATLPLKLRQSLADAFEKGAKRDPVPLGSAHYPSLTIVGGQHAPKIQAKQSVRGKVRVERIGDVEAAATLLCDAPKKGAACVWIRNSVDDAIAAKKMLETMAISPLLFHARFTFGDRQGIEREVLDTFGRERENDVGKILIATQVVESSLDLDFDVMVSDLAPMASLVQRAGRLWRHMTERPQALRPVTEPVLHVVSPDPADVKNEMWLKNVMDKGAYVYPAALQWRTATHLFKVGGIDAPLGLRDLIETVHGEGQEDVPEALLKAEHKAIGEDAAQKNRGQQNTIDLTKDFRNGGADHDDVKYPTRLGPEQRTLMLVKRVNGSLRLWHGVGAEGEMLSEVSAAKHRLEKHPLPSAGEEPKDLLAFKKNWPEWKKASITVVEVQTDGSLVEGLKYSQTMGLVFHNSG
jgi:CRISPR-associated endonuclease/helicase Cas3